MVRAKAALPNAAHKAIARFSLPSIRHQIAPESTFTLITQNVDGLSKRALDEVLSSQTIRKNLEGESDPVMLEMHGRLFDVLCTSRACEHQEYNDKSPICEALAGTEALLDHGTVEPNISAENLPRCSKCGALARPGVVWFGEVPYHLDTIDELVDKADLCLVVGTSSVVCNYILIVFFGNL